MLWYSCQEPRVHLQSFTKNLRGASGLDRLCVDNRDQGGVVSDPRVQMEHPGTELTIWGTLRNTRGPEQSCQPRETCLTVAVIQQWAPSNLAQTLLPGRALA